MIIVLEGPDNAGKTTLARHVQANSSVAIEYFHPGGPPKDLCEEHLCMSSQYKLLSSGDDLIHDRLTCVSQQVYNPDVLRDPERRSALDDVRSLPNIMIVYCRPSTDRLMRKEDFTWRDGESEAHKQKIIDNQHVFIQRYDEIMARVPHLLYDFDDPLSDWVRTHLVMAMSGSETCANALGNVMRAGDLRS